MKKKRTIDWVNREKSTVGTAMAMWRAAVVEPPRAWDRVQPEMADRTSPASVKTDKSVSANATGTHYNTFGLRTERGGSLMTPRTLVDIFRNLADTPKPDLLLIKQGGKWNPISTMEFMDRVKAVPSALENLGVKQGGRVALLSENRPERSIVDFACQCYGAVLVPIDRKSTRLNSSHRCIS